MNSRLPLVAVIAACTALNAGCGVRDPYRPSATRTTTTSSPTTAEQAPASPDAAEARPDLSPAQRRAERTARTFLAGYLPYRYGQATARRIRAATPTLRRELAANPPRVGAAVRRAARVSLRQLHTSGLNGPRAYVLAQIDDGSRIYATSLTIERHGRRWLVAAVR